MLIFERCLERWPVHSRDSVLNKKKEERTFHPPTCAVHEDSGHMSGLAVMAGPTPDHTIIAVGVAIGLHLVSIKSLLNEETH